MTIRWKKWECAGDISTVGGVRIPPPAPLTKKVDYAFYASDVITTINLISKPTARLIYVSYHLAKCKLGIEKPRALIIDLFPFLIQV